MRFIFISLFCIAFLTSAVASAAPQTTYKSTSLNSKAYHGATVSADSEFTLLAVPRKSVEIGKNLKFGVENVPNKAKYITLVMGTELVNGVIADPEFITKKRDGQSGKRVFKYKIPSDIEPGKYYFQAYQNKGYITNFIEVEIVSPGAECEFPFIMNASGIEDWREQDEFNNIMQGAREGAGGVWLTKSANSSAWDSAVAVPVDARGYPTVAIPYNDPALGDTTLHTLLKRELKGDTYEPAGIHTFCVEGTNLDITLGMDANNVRVTEAGCHPVDITPSKNGIQVKIEQADTLTNLALWIPGTSEDTNAVYNDMFKKPLADAGLSGIRAMDLMQTNHSEVEHWSDRKAVGHVIQSGDNGMNYELLITMVDELRALNPALKTLWINVPHLATDDFIRSLAYLYRDNLDRAVNLKVEYSNEVWNGIFAQSSHCKDIGLQWTSDPTKARAYCQAHQISRVGDIFKQVYGSEFESRVTLVAGAWANNSWYTQQIIDGLNDPAINQWGTQVQEIAIAPYIGGNIADDLCDNFNTNAQVDDVLDMLDAELDPGARFDSNVRSNYDVVTPAGIKLIAYEGGQHLVAEDSSCSTPQREDLTTLFTDVNEHPRIRDIYNRMYDEWANIVGSSNEFAVFSYITASDKYGSWGTFEYSNQPYEDAPKYMSILDQKDKFCGGE